MSCQVSFTQHCGPGLSTPVPGQGRSPLQSINLNNLGDMSQVTFSSATSKENVAEKRRRLESELLKLSDGNIYGDKDEDVGVP
jgi:hypothetical protein